MSSACSETCLRRQKQRSIEDGIFENNKFIKQGQSQRFEFSGIALLAIVAETPGYYVIDQTVADHQKKIRVAVWERVEVLRAHLPETLVMIEKFEGKQLAAPVTVWGAAIACVILLAPTVRLWACCQRQK